MNGVWYAGIGALFVLGLLFLLVYLRRGQISPGRHGAAGNAAVDDADDAPDDAGAVRQEGQAAPETPREPAASVLAQARSQADEVLADARRQASERLEGARTELDRQRIAQESRAARLRDAEARLEQQEERLAQRARELHQQSTDLATTRQALDERARELQSAEAAVRTAAAEQQAERERIAGLTAAEARSEVLAAAETVARRDAAVLVRTIENEARAEGSERARNIVADAVQRVASSQTTESVVSVLHLPADDMKGRIIGREGRNIRSFESVTGVNVLIDDTPEAVLLSCFDPVRREIGRLTLQKLVDDGRIHPHRIEDAYEQSVAEVDELCLRAARDALAEVGIGPVDERLLPTLGRLRYRTSYGQNVLGHLIETAHIAGTMAAELGVDPVLVKRCAFLHDIGKALTHEVEGSHAIVGAELLRKYDEDEAVVHAVEAHHNEVQPRTVEAVLTQASDTCSAARPGARRESLENYVKRLARIEEIAATHDGVEKVFAMQSGREVRVMVQPAEVDDLAASVMAREIAKQIEDELTYPGQIRVTVVRESRATEIAH